MAARLRRSDAIFKGPPGNGARTHLKRNVLDACPRFLQDELASRLRLLFDAPDLATARQLLADILDQFTEQAPRAMERLEQGFEDAMAVMILPRPYRRRLRSTNILERLNLEIRRRERVIRIFPNAVSALCLLGAVLMEQDETWSTGWRYFNMDAYYEWKAAQERNNTLRNKAAKGKVA